MFIKKILKHIVLRNTVSLLQIHCIDCSSSAALSMNTVLACVLLCACAVAALPAPHHRELRSPSPARERREDVKWKVETDPNGRGGQVVRGEVGKKWDVTKDGKVIFHLS